MAGTPCEGCSLKGRPSVDCMKPEMEPGGVFFLGGFPDYGSTVNGVRHIPFNGLRTKLLRNIVEQKKSSLANGSKIRCTYGYACKCNPDFNRETKRYNISVVEYSRCSAYAKDYIDLQRPDVIVALGTDAYRVLGLNGTVADRRCRPAYYKDKHGRSIPVVCTFDVGLVAKKQGLLLLFENDILNALTFGQEDEVHENHSKVLLDADAIVDELERMNMKVSEAKTVDERMLAFDTETTSLTPQVLEDRIIAMSFSCENDEGIAFPYQHRDHAHSEEDLARITAAVEKLLTNDNAVICTSNGGFDLKWLWARGIACKDHKWDVMLAEHVLDENKQGEYSLKDITRLKFPKYGDYEAELTQLRNERWAEKDARIKELAVAAKDASADKLFNWWTSLGSDDEREKFLGGLVAKGIVPLSEASGLKTVKTIKRGGVVAPSKKYRATVLKVFQKVPESELPEEASVNVEIPPELVTKSYEDIDIDMLLHYAAMDAIVTRLIALRQYQEMKNSDKDDKKLKDRYRVSLVPQVAAYRRISMPLSVELAHMELHGIRFDRDRAKDFQGIIDASTEKVLDSMYTAIGYRFNPNSSADLVKILYEDLKLPVKAYTGTNNPATNEAALRDLYEEHRDLTVIDDILNYRRLSKTSGTYLANWLKQSEYDGYIHCSFNQTGTATYRLSSSNPNLQNVPFSLHMPDGSMLNLKSLFLPDEGFDLYDLDIKNAEMRVLCAYSGDENLISAFNEGKDLHSLTAAGISGIPYEQLCKYKEDKTRPEYMQRQVAKKVNFGTIYCMSGATLKKNLWNDNRISVTEEEADKYLEGFFETYPGVKKYIEDTKSFVNDQKFTYTYFGRRRRFPYAWYMSNDRERIHRQAVNARIQSTSSDMVMMCLVRLNRHLRSLENGSQVLLTVHDSIPFQAPKGMHEHIKETLDRIIVKETAELCPWLPVEWAYDCGWGQNYGDTHGEIK